MKQSMNLVLVAVLGAFVWHAPQSRSSAAMPAPPSFSPPMGPWTTGITQTPLGDGYYGGSQTHYIDLTTTGVYDPDLWVVILDYNTMTVEAGSVVKFLPHPTNAPVVIRSLGPIVIDGEINVDGADGHGGNDYPVHALPGPGGFRGGTGYEYSVADKSDGFGPGGGFAISYADNYFNGGGSHASAGGASSGLAGPTYGGGSAVPLIGGSGASGAGPYGGGAGGGAILIGSDSSITLGPDSLISARGGVSGLLSGSYFSAAGSGGTVRIASPSVSWSGGGYRVDARGGYVGGYGRIRIEMIGTPINGPISTIPGGVQAQQLSEFLPVDLPEITIASWYDTASGQWIPLDQDPKARIYAGDEADAQLPTSGMFDIRVEGTDIPQGAEFYVRVTDTGGAATNEGPFSFGLDHFVPGGGGAPSYGYTDVTLDFPLGISTLQVRAKLQ